MNDHIKRVGEMYFFQKKKSFFEVNFLSLTFQLSQTRGKISVKNETFRKQINRNLNSKIICEKDKFGQSGVSRFVVEANLKSLCPKSS